ncbi:MAG: 2,3-bisphosphoglycerate-independent phosphoglycerate mutase [Candidatus Hydrogenedentes bacterium]|nr:2,3-bisphosphoglycerate-independent phosphoglycerate mutase [Candidatus Hydrogenedentota bacterium]
MSNYTLEQLEGYRPFPGPVVCAILDGIGLGKRDESDGVCLANTPVLDALMTGPLYTQLKAHGTAVGMPSDSDMGNSEVGHNTLGAGRVYPQGAKRVHEALASGALYDGEGWSGLMQRAKSGGTVHFIGLLSDGNVHSHIDHLFALLDRCREEKVQKVRVHVLLDGRDVGEKSALRYLAPTEKKLAELSAEGREYRIASGGGRMVTTMDRYKADWSIVERGWKAHVLGEGRAFASASEAVQTYYDEDPAVTDQYLDSFVVTENGKPAGTIEDGDAVLFFNFRGDRALELSKAFEVEEFAHFDRKRRPGVFYAGMMEYDGDTHTPAHYLVEPSRKEGVLSEYLCASGVTSFAISETQKYGHVTYFWNGNKTDYIDERLEEYVEVPSDRVPFDQRPWMKAAEITDATIAAVKGGQHKFIRLNYANGDMVAHTGVPAATRIAVEAVDLALARLLPAIEQAGGIALLLADHGNADLMFTEKDGRREPHVAHTLNPVPCMIQDYSGVNRFRMKPKGEIPNPGLSHIAATLCNFLGFEAPQDYDPSLIVLDS